MEVCVVKGKLPKVLIIVLIMLIVGAVTYFLASHLEKDTSLESGVYSDTQGIEYNIYQDLTLRDFTSVCTETKDFFVVTEYISVSNIPNGGCYFAWEIGEGDEVSYVDSNKGLLDYISDNNNVLISLDGSESDMQLVVYVKTQDLDKTLNNIPISNEKIKIVKDFGYTVVLPDGSKEEFDKNDAEDTYITLKDYFDMVYKSK